MKKVLCLAFLICYVPISSGYIYQAIIMRKWNTMQQKYHYFLGLGDYHAKQHVANNIHREQLIDLLTDTHKDDLRIITEDLSVPNIEGRYICGRYCVNSRGGLLGGLTEICRDMGIQTDNIEYRYARVCSLGPLLNHIDENPYGFDSVASIKLANVYDEVYGQIDQIRMFQDGSQLNAWYKQCTKMVEAKLDNLQWAHMKEATMADYISCMDNKRLSVIKKMLTFDSRLLDLKLVHEVMNSHEKDRVCVIAGGSHIERASKALKKVGYKTLLQTMLLYQKDDDISRCIGSDMHRTNANSGLKPQPIDLQQLQRFF